MIEDGAMSTEPSSSSVCLVVEGGGMRGFFAAGVLDGLLEAGADLRHVYAVSSGCLGAAHYCAHAPRPDFAALGRRQAGSLLRLRGLVDPRAGLLRTDELIDALTGSALESTRLHEHRLHVCATRAVTGELVWWDISEMDVCAARARLVASCSIPVVMPQAFVDGEVYADGGIVDSIPLAHALTAGFDRAILICSRPRGYRKPVQHLELYLRRWLAPYPALKRAMLTRHERYNAAMEDVERAEDAGVALVFRPAVTRVGRFEYSPAKFEADYEDGLAAARTRAAQVRAFLAG